MDGNRTKELLMNLTDNASISSHLMNCAEVYICRLNPPLENFTTSTLNAVDRQGPLGIYSIFHVADDTARWRDKHDRSLLPVGIKFIIS